MIAYQDIRDVHLEPATLCNAKCPWCPRNFWGYPFNGGYPETYLSLDQAKIIFSPQFLKQLESIEINGNFGDIVMNPDGADIVEYFIKINKNLKVWISTNGAARKKDFWVRLAKTGAVVSFDIDGLEDTHHLYRQNTSWQTVIKNAKIFIENGGHAEWKFILFEHNKHQVKPCQTLSEQLGFKKFVIVNNGRDTAPVFDKYGNLTHVLGNYTGETDFKILFDKKINDEVVLEDITSNRNPCNSINCKVVERKSIYVAANGEVYPCCWTGHYPNTYGKGQYHQAANAQLIPLIKENNALMYPLKQCIQWFDNIEKSWQKENYKNGRLVICDEVCGISTNR